MNEKKNVNEIVAAGALVCDQVQIDDTVPIEKMSKARFTAVRQLDGKPYPANFTDMVAAERKKDNGLPIHVERTEASLLNFLLGKCVHPSRSMSRLTFAQLKSPCTILISLSATTLLVLILMYCFTV